MKHCEKTAVVTGGNSGIGFETAKALLTLGWRVIITGRDETKLRHAISRLESETHGETLFRLGDFSSFSSVRALAAQLLDEERIDVLLNNVGVALTERRVTPDGNEMVLQVNHLSPFLLTNLLLDKIKASASARIVNVSSDSHMSAPDYGFDDFQFARSYTLYKSYSRTKLYNILFTTELARRLKGTGVTANALHPGAVATALGRDGDFGGVMTLIWPIIQGVLMSAPESGSKVTCYVATAPELENVSGQYFSTGLRAVQPSRLARADQAARQLWELSTELVGLN